MAMLSVQVQPIIRGMSRLHRQNLFLKVMSLPKRPIMQNIQIVLHLNRKATDTTPPTAPLVTSDLTGEATTTDPVEVTTDPNTKVELLDKDGNVIGSGTTDNTGMSRLHRRNLFLKVMLLRKLTIMQNIQIVLHLNRKATIQRRQRRLWLLAI